MAINAQHKQYKKFYPLWKKITDNVEQENLDEYLINTFDKSREERYKERAVYYAFTADTVKGQVGLMFSQQPKIELPLELEYLRNNIDGRGNSIVQQAKRVARNVDSISRDGYYTSYPITDGEVSKADINSGHAVATIQEISADRIINWREESFGSKIKLTLLVFKDTKAEEDDYEVVEKETIRELYLDEKVYKERLWVKDKDNEWIPGKELTPRDKNGLTFDEIQFDFVGAENNDSDCDVPNMLAMTEINIGHFRNSADYEDNVWWLGQAQSWMSGITQSHIDLMKANNMFIGSKELIGVPSGESFGINAAPPNVMVADAMDKKEQRMIAFGANQLKQSGQAKTATQVNSESQSKHSTLSLIADNVSDALTSALSRAERFMTGSVSNKAIFRINTDFIKPDSNPQELKEISAGWQTGSMPTSDYVRNMKDLGKFDKAKSDDDYIAELDEMKASDMPEEL